MKKLIISFLALSLFYISFGQKKEVAAYRTTEKIKIDGYLTERSWSLAEPATDFIQFEPINGGKVKQKTVVKVLYDQTGIYIGAIMYDTSPDSIGIDFVQRDEESPYTDVFAVMIDPYKNGLYAFNFRVTASNVQFDEKMTPRGGDRSWNAVWFSKTRLTDSGWIAEIKIPYSALRFSKTQEQSWAINFFRYVARYREIYSWNFIDKNKPGFIEQFGILTNLKGIKPPFRLALLPYITAYAQNSQEQWSYFVRGGMDLKYGLSEGFTLDMMLIPDFGQVESDDQVLNLSPFETYYVEKRQFFTEGSELFSKAQLFYSRRIGSTPIDYYKPYYELNQNEIIVSNPSQTQILNATKITGRNHKGLGLGILNAITMPTYAEITDTLTGSTRKILTQDYTNYNVSVIDYNFKGNSYISLINTNVWIAGGRLFSNATGTDYQIRLKDGKYTLSGIAAISARSEFAENPTIGYRNEIKFSKTKGKFRYGLQTNIVSDKYEINDLGFLTRNNFIENRFWLSVNQFTPQWIFLNYWLRTTFGYDVMYKDLAFNKTFIAFGGGGTLKNLWNIHFWAFQQLKDEFDWYEPRVPGRFYRDPKVSFINFNLNTDMSKPVAISLGGRIFYSTPEKNGYNLRGSLQLRLSKRMNLNYSVNFDNAHRYGFVDYKNYDTIYFGYRLQRTFVNTLVLNYAINNTQALRFRLRHYWSIADYSDQFFLLNYDGTLTPTDFYTIADINFNAFTIDFSYTWNFAPGSEIKIVWKNQIYTYDQIPIYNYFENLDHTLSAPQFNSFSVKFLYYLDWTYFQKNVKPKVASTILRLQDKLILG